jgi:hypothetical protein
MSFIFGGGSSGGGGGGSTTSGTQTNIAREAPEVEARKLSLYDQAAKLATSPVNLPGLQVAPLSPLEQAGITQSGTTGVGASTVGSGITSLQNSLKGPNINQFLNPYQSYVTNEIGRQGQIMSNQLSANAVNSGAYGGGREGVQQAELQGQTLAKMGESLGQGFQSAAGLAGQQQGIQQAGAQIYGQMGQQQQAMARADINQQMQAGALQRGVGQAGLEATRQTALQKAYEPYQRVEFLKGIMTNLPTTQSSITATTAPGANPLSQALGTGLGAYSAYNMMQPKQA